MPQTCSRKVKKYEPSYYLPISHTSLCYKFEEHILVSNILNHLDEHHRRALQGDMKLTDATLSLLYELTQNRIQNKTDRLSNSRFLRSYVIIEYGAMSTAWSSGVPTISQGGVKLSYPLRHHVTT